MSWVGLVIEKHGLKFAFLMNGLCAIGVLIPATILMKCMSTSTSRTTADLFNSSKQTAQSQVPSVPTGFVQERRFRIYLSLGIFHPGKRPLTALIHADDFRKMAYATGIYSIPSYATQGLGLTQQQGSVNTLLSYTTLMSEQSHLTEHASSRSAGGQTDLRYLLRSDWQN